MKKLLILIGLFSFSLGLQAQTTNEDFDKIREQMLKNMEDMMQLFEGSFDMSEGPMIKMDTFFFKGFGGFDENGQMMPGQDSEAFFNDLEKMMKQYFGDLDFEGFAPFGDQPAIPAPDELDEKSTTPKENSPAPKVDKKKRKTFSL